MNIKTFLVGMSVITLAAVAIAASSVGAAQLTVVFGGMALAAIA